jgi:hypothetical protein
MAKDDKSARQPRDQLIGQQELKEAHAAPDASVQGLTLEVAPRKAANETSGFDPYNTSGSFDRKKNWVRVGKR